MTKTTKTLLILAAVNLVAGLAFATDLLDVHDSAVFYVALPLGAIFLGLFLISRMLEKETARYDAEQRNILVALKSPAEQQASASPAAARPTLAKAH
jgi:TRAP-type C4-dicarboxylate transport system permease small subunit